MNLNPVSFGRDLMFAACQPQPTDFPTVCLLLALSGAVLEGDSTMTAALIDALLEKGVAPIDVATQQLEALSNKRWMRIAEHVRIFRRVDFGSEGH